MNADTEREAWLAKARENLASAASKVANGRYNACANRAYYACFQAAVAALTEASIRPSRDGWGHDFVQAQFAGQLVTRRNRYPAALRDTLPRLFDTRRRAYYEPASVSLAQADRAVRRAREFVTLTAGVNRP